MKGENKKQGQLQMFSSSIQLSLARAEEHLLLTSDV